MDTFSIGGVARRAFRIFGLHAIGFSAFAIVVAALPNWLGLLWANPRVQEIQTAIAGGQQPGVGPYVAIAALNAAPSLVTYLGNLVLVGMIATAAWRDVEGHPPDLRASLRSGLGLFLPLLLLSILFALGILLGTILLVVPGLILTYMWFVATPVYAIERPGFTIAFGRSRHLTAGYRWKLVGLTLIYFVAYGAMSGVIAGALVTLAKTGGSTGPALVLQLLGAVIAGLFAVVSAAGVAATYIELRRAKEGYLSSDLVDAFS